MSIGVELKKKLLDLTENMECKKSEIPGKIGITYTSYTTIIKYGAIPMVNTLIKIADYFNVSVEYLIGRTNDDYFEKAKDLKSFTERLDALKNAENITYYELGKRVHLSGKYFTDWRNRDHLPNLDNLMLIADYFKVSVDYLLGRTDDKNL